MPKIETIIMVDDHTMLMDGLAKVLAEAGINVIRKITDAEQGVKEILERKPNLVLMDINIKPFSGIEATKRITDQSEIPVMILSMYDDPPHMQQALKAGAVGYIVKTSHEEELIKAIQRIGEGGTWFPRAINDSQTEAKKYNFSDIELDILRQEEQSMSVKEIAKKYFVSVQTIYYHKRKIREKTLLSTSAAQIKFVRDLGLL